MLEIMGEGLRPPPLLKAHKTAHGYALWPLLSGFAHYVGHNGRRRKPGNGNQLAKCRKACNLNQRSHSQKELMQTWPMNRFLEGSLGQFVRGTYFLKSNTHPSYSSQNITGGHFYSFTDTHKKKCFFSGWTTKGVVCKGVNPPVH